MTDEKFYSVTEVAARYGVSTATVRRWASDGTFPGTVKQNPLKKNSPKLIPQSALDFFEEQRKASASN